MPAFSRFRLLFGSSLLAIAFALALPVAAQAEDGPAWQVCVGASTTPDGRVAACSAVIDSKTETGKRLAGAYCNRGEALTEKGEFDRALADLDEAIRLDPDYACPHSNRGRVFALK